VPDSHSCTPQALDGHRVNVRGVIVVVFARLGGEGVSIISMRPASKSERKLFHDNQERGD
jgi:uncharacterized DUF497 family protein